MPEVTTVQAGTTINFAWTITPSLTNADQRQAYQAFIEPDFTLANTFALGALVIGVMRGNTNGPHDSERVGLPMGRNGGYGLLG